MIEKGLVALLLGQMPLGDQGRQQFQSLALGQCGGQRIWPNAAPQPVGGRPCNYPYLVLRKLAGGRSIQGFQGQINQALSMIALIAVGELTQDVKMVVDYAGKALRGYRGLAGPYWVQGIFSADLPDEYAPPEHSTEKGVQAAGLALSVWHSE